MAEKENSTTKRFKITQAQEYMLAAVLGASVAFGVTIALLIHFVQKIAFNGTVMTAVDQSIAAYSNTLKSTGACVSPADGVYTDEEISKCNPKNISADEVKGSLRYNVLHNLALNSALNSVPKEADSVCVNPNSKDGRSYTAQELQDLEQKAADTDDPAKIQEASQLIRSCSALRIIPDALPASYNEEALLASLNKLLIISGPGPESLSPSGTSNATLNNNIKAFSVKLAIDYDTETTMNVLRDVERSIREFNIERATIEWNGPTLKINANATAYYMDKSNIVESSNVIKPGEKAK